MVLGTEKKSFFLRPFLGLTPLRSSPKSNIIMHHFVTPLCHGCYRVNYKAKYKVVTTMFHGCYNLELQPCYNLVAPL